MEPIASDGMEEPYEDEKFIVLMPHVHVQQEVLSCSRGGEEVSTPSRQRPENNATNVHMHNSYTLIQKPAEAYF